MDDIGKWLKSLRLHKYTPLFQQLTYDQMLNLDEDFLIEQNITKGARKKMLDSVNRLKLRAEQLTSMITYLDQNSISIKEALTVLKDIMTTPIPPPKNDATVTNVTTAADKDDLTYLFIESLQQVAQRFINATTEVDNTCHGIMAAIVDECIKHKSFSKQQKDLVAGYKTHLRQRSSNNHRSATSFNAYNNAPAAAFHINGYHYNTTNHYYGYSHNNAMASILSKAHANSSGSCGGSNYGTASCKSGSSFRGSSDSVVGNAVSKRQYNQNFSKHLGQKNDHAQTSNKKQDRGHSLLQLQAQFKLEARQQQQVPLYLSTEQHLVHKPRTIMPIQPPSSFSSSPPSSTPLLSPASSLSSDTSSFGEYSLLGPTVATFELPCLRSKVAAAAAAAQTQQRLYLGAARCI